MAMAWKSSTFKKSDTAGRKTTKEAISGAVSKHRDAMSGVIRNAKELAEDRRKTLHSIQDPELKRSAAR
jgi:hypothetical protein